jgi:hypothetical protein
MSGRSSSATAARAPPSIASLVAQTREAEASATEGHETLTALLAKSDDLIARHREGLLEVARLSAELAEIEKRRAVLKSALASQKVKLLIISAETAEVSQLIERAVQPGDQAPISAGLSGTIALESVEKIQAAVFALTEKCLGSDRLTVAREDAGALICTVSDIVEEAVNAGGAQEAPEDTIRRLSGVIAAIAPQPGD